MTGWIRSIWGQLSTAEGRAPFYALAWLLSGMAAGAMAVWLVTLIRWDWPVGTEAQRLTILGNALFGTLGLMALVTLGLTMRNAIRNLKGSIGAVSAEAEGHD
jgi:type VI protein secretion system component VasK